jgi:2-dehydro-3-deoxygluconokinase
LLSIFKFNPLEDCFYEEEPYNNIEVVDRIGSGDAYLAGALFGMIKYQSLQKAVEYGNAMAAVKKCIALWVK